ncbi:MAG TPA: hypothetical protein VHI95_02155 [Acidimicrobiales bacterium]|jgi:hypothetical protein|nr:hypothetical protein [Acidimicrobiales bacterium]
MSERQLTVVERYIELGLRLGRLLDGLVDAYYGPPELARRVEAEPTPDPAKLAADARHLIADLDSGEGGDDIDAHRRRWIRGQVRGLHVTASRFAGETIGFVDEVEQCYGVRPTRVDDDAIADAQHRIDAVLPGTGPLGARLIAWREAQTVATDKLDAAINSLADDFRERTDRMFGLPDGERIDFELVTNEPWSGFNYYLGDLHSRVAINTDLPVLSTSLGHLVAHEAYPGHHTEHSRKEVGLVRRRGQLEETIFLVGTPQCLLAEGLADLGLEVIVPDRRHEVVAAHLQPLGIPYDAEIATAVAEAGELLGNAVRGNVAIALHEDGMAPDDAVAYVERFGLLPHNRAQKAVEFQTDPTWRAYIFCYIDGLRLCRRYVDGRPDRFARLVTESLLPDDLAA